MPFQSVLTGRNDEPFAGVTWFLAVIRLTIGLKAAVCMGTDASVQIPWTNEQKDAARRWVEAWRVAGPALEAVRARELRELDGHRAIALLTGPADYRAEPRKARSSSGLVEQQRWFMKARPSA